ncbi:hypothetical protein GCM10007301_30540 [Azorhizobium oxalatiphilum]|uniref:PBP domain-containing protein n=1 Tax=Azorhizobium oxalatiphilum TaxID=980631 RepID=A0A917C4P0_9HYPH|nr:substrate-binding domain-containing protein [Azorhizobium oxalatiphilum]GGF68755.1 hypothetical protein GCM10007301_30540 [Azorhizobium oxalatiphilum]
MDHASHAALPDSPPAAGWMPRPVDGALPVYEPRPVAVPEGATYLTDDGRVRISGSEHGQFIFERFCAAFEEVSGIRFHVDLRGTPSAMAFITNGQSLLSVMGREITPVEVVPYRKCVGAPPVAIRIAHAAEETSQHLATSLGLYVHRSNPLARMTTTELSQVFTIGNPGGDFSVWGQLGLDGDWATRPIHPIGTPEFTGFGTYMQKHHLANRVPAPAYERLISTDNVLGRLAATPSGIAVAAIGRETDDIRMVPLSFGAGQPYSDGSTQDVIDGAYPFGRFLYAYVRQQENIPLDPLAQEFLRFVLAREGQAIIAAQPRGYIPLTAAQARAETAALARILPHKDAQK